MVVCGLPFLPPCSGAAQITEIPWLGEILLGYDPASACVFNSFSTQVTQFWFPLTATATSFQTEGGAKTGENAWLV
jgi:hypothetical protein